MIVALVVGAVFDLLHQKERQRQKKSVSTEAMFFSVSIFAKASLLNFHHDTSNIFLTPFFFKFFNLLLQIIYSFL
jgi:hypothetical protein